ncbi:MAG: putative 4-hydroxybenzoate polyprenyltransferase [Trueperaceae bacterium]|nr:putative 4-hydroxybenzoate polyprenyltransferase [Trueperaceae bacterium]
MTKSQGSRDRRLKSYLEFVKFEHTLFALPFAYGGMLLAERAWPGWITFGWISLAMVGARTASMAINRVVDASIDAQNPRTQNREIPRGALGKLDGWLLTLFGFLLLAVAGWALNPLTLWLLPVAVFFLALYPYTKRFTWLCHYWLGLSIGAAAAGGWIAVTGEFALAALFLWAGVGLWIAGFDIVYALLDLEFDREHGVYSIPAQFGQQRALQISAFTHGVAWFCLLATWPLSHSGIAYLLGLIVVGGILFYAQYLVRKRGVGEALRSFNANLYVSSVVLAAIILDLLVKT